MLRYILPLITALLAQALPAQQTNENLKGLLWEVSGNNIAKTGYLYGTMHVPEKLAFNLSDSFFIALRQVDMVALETDHDRWQEFTEMLDGRGSELFNPSYGGGGYSGGRTMPQENLYNAQFLFKVPENQLLGAMLSAKPRLTNEFLYRSNTYRQDYEEDTYLDLFIFQAGRKLGKKVIGLETLEGSYEALVRAQLPDEEEEQPDRGYYGGLSRQTMEDAYRDQDLTLMDSLNKLASPGKNFQRWMLDERNLIMVNGIDSILQSGTALFSAVGAAHLPGQTGLIRLLRERGYTVRPVQFSSVNSKREKETIEALRFPVQFARQWAADSTWSVEAPGKFYQTVDGMGLEQQLCADMSNGAYYAVYRLHSYGMWNGQSPAYIAERIDSLIYEKIPGKIQTQTRFDTPFPGHEITTRTRRGDIIRYKVFVTPMEVFVFATGGNGDYASGTEGARFVNSIQFHRQELAVTGGGVRHLAPPEGGFAVDMPAPVVMNTTSDKKADRYLAGALDPADSTFYLLYRAVYHDWNYIEEDSFELNIIAERIAEQFTKATPEYQLVAASPYPTQDVSFRADQDSAWYYLRLVIDGPQYYLLGCRKNQPGAPTAFFNSFSIQPNQYPQGWELLRDTNMLFEAMVPKASLKPETPFLDKLQSIIREGMQKSKRSSDYGDSRPRNQFRLLELPLQGEAISISSFPMIGAGPANTLDSFQSFVLKMLTGAGKLALREKHWEPPTDNLLVGSFVVEDTNSTRGIRAKVVLTPGRLYTLVATVHLDAPANALIDKVFNSFTPKDTTQGTLPLGRRDLDYLQEIYSPDSLIRGKALSRLESSWLRNTEPTDFPVYRKAIEHPEFGKLRINHRHSLLSALGNFHTPEALNYVLGFLQRYPDSIRYRQSLLVTLAQMQTQNAQKALLQQLGRENKFVSNSTIADIFEAFSDSLELSVQQLPSLLKLADQDIYREEVINLIHLACLQGLVKAKVYRRLKPQLLREVYQSLGQQQLMAEMKQDARNDDRYGMRDYYSPYAGNNSDDLGRNLRLLAPFLKNDPEVRELFDQVLQSPEQEIQILAMSLLLQEGRPVREKALQAFAEDDRTRYMLYRNLADVNQISNTYAPWFADTLALVRSILFEEMADQRDNDENGLDSVRFLSSHQTLRYKSPAIVYFFEVKKKKSKEWCLAYVNIALNSKLFAYSSEVDPDAAYSRYDRRYWQHPEVKLLTNLPEKEKAEYIRKKIGEVRFANRERYRKWSGGEDYYFEE